LQYQARQQENSFTSIDNLKKNVKTHKNLLGYREFIQFCTEFHLKSTSLLTAVEVGEVYLSCVPFTSSPGNVTGIRYEGFVKALVTMSFLAYRNFDRITSPPVNKFNGLLLYMWKAMNSEGGGKEKAMLDTLKKGNQVGDSGKATAIALFLDQFISHWSKDGFREYIEPETSKNDVRAVRLHSFKNIFSKFSF